MIEFEGKVYGMFWEQVLGHVDYVIAHFVVQGYYGWF